MQLYLKQRLRQKRRWRIRRKVRGNAERPRLVLTLTGKHLYAQAINDEKGETLVFVSTNSKDIRAEGLRPTMEGASALGKIVGERAKAAGIERVCFDRAGRRYHGKVKAFAEAAREAGLQF
ncbi:MAG: 50S ribosomal protein L18 [Opitutales bacterium]